MTVTSVHDLQASGCTLNTDKRRDLLKMTLNGFGVKMNKNALEVHASPDTFPLRKHSLIQAMLAVNDLFYLAKPVVESLFFEDVVEWLDVNEIRYTPKVKFTGISGTTMCSTSVIPKSRHQSERVVQAIGTAYAPGRAIAHPRMEDTRQVWPADSKAYALLNDGDPVPGEMLEALQNYEFWPVLWEARAEVVAELAA